MPSGGGRVRSATDDVDTILIGAGAIGEAVLYVEEQAYRSIIVAVDANTYPAAGQRLEELLRAKRLAVHVTIIKPDRQGDVIADEASLIQLLHDVKQQGAEAVIAVGGGTIHDIVRYCAYMAGIPFISVPTAPSVDGFNSKGAPILIRGEKITIAAIGPNAIFADLDVLMKAPSALTAAGFGDMLGKYTSLFDWSFGSLTAGEPYSLAAAERTRSALLQCVNQSELIARRQEEGIAALMSALIESGLAMLSFGQSHPASGAEHHLSHYWEMEYIRLGKRQLLHGAKVGAACVEIARLYHRIADEGIDGWSNSGSHERESPAAADAIAANWPQIRKHIADIPDSGTLTGLLRGIGGPASVSELQVSDELLARSMREAHRVRMNRYTLLRAYNERANAANA
ncbi:sn-glycerol-1-phosphate dehydrogenase [Paenibacillus piri]|nr:sn-glycerol-1-phosphate dehydrogenase [Paenibacillus piri]